MKLTIKVFDKIPNSMKPFMDEAFRLAVLYHAEELQNQVKLNVSGKILRKRTGNLLMAWSTPVRLETHGGWGQVQTVAKITVNSKYARIHEEPLDAAVNVIPTATGTILRARPENKSGLLRFFIEDEGVWVTTKQVEIPARRYISIGFETMKVKSERLSKLAVRDAARATGRKS